MTLRRKELSDSSHNLAELDGSDSECEGLDAAEEDSVPGSSTPTTSLSHPTTDYFAILSCLREKEPQTIPFPLRTFHSRATAFYLAYDPPIQRIDIDSAARQFGLPDLHATLADYLTRDEA
jgi:hypothetical protein